MAGNSCDGTFAFTDNGAWLSDEGRFSVIVDRRWTLMLRKFEILVRKETIYKVYCVDRDLLEPSFSKSRARAKIPIQIRHPLLRRGGMAVGG
jgi:hypothetical protein